MLTALSLYQPVQAAPISSGSDVEITIDPPADPAPDPLNCAQAPVPTGGYVCYTLTVTPDIPQNIVLRQGIDPPPTFSWSATVSIVSKPANVTGIAFLGSYISSINGYNALCTSPTTDGWVACLSNASAYGPGGGQTSTASGSGTLIIQNSGFQGYNLDTRVAFTYINNGVAYDTGQFSLSSGFNIDVLSYKYSVSPTSLSFSAEQGGTPPPLQYITVTNEGEAVNISISDNASWLGVYPSNLFIFGVPCNPCTASVEVSVSTNLSPGTYNATITFSESNAGNKTVSVTYQVSPVAPGTCPSNNVFLSAASADVLGSATASAPAGWSGGTFSSSNTGVATANPTTGAISAVEGGTTNISGSGWTASNGATNCPLSPATFTVRDFTVTAPVVTQTVTQGNPASFTINVNPVNSFAQSVSLSQSGAPSSPGPVTLSPSSGTPFYSSILAIPTSLATAPGTYTVTIRGTYSVHTHSQQVSLTVNPAGSGDFSLSMSPPSPSINPGGNQTYNVSATSINNFSGSVSLSSSGCPPNATCSLDSSTLTLSAGGTAQTTLRVQTAPSTTAGTYTLTTTGISGSLSHSASAQLTVQGAAQDSCTLSASPQSGTAPLSGTLSWTVGGSPTSCTASGGWSGNKSVTGGSQSYGPLSSDTAYALNCSSATASWSCSTNVTVTSQPAPGTMVVNLSASPGSGPSPHTETLDAIVSWNNIIPYFFDYYLWWNCPNPGPNPSDPASVEANCGALPASGSNSNGYKLIGSFSSSLRVTRSYSSNATPYVIAITSGLADNDNALVSITYPDLIGENLQVTGSLTSGSILSFSGTVRNGGGANVGVNTVTRMAVDINNDGTWDVVPADNTTGPLSVGATENETWSNVWTATAGTHKYSICVDRSYIVAESNEFNNCPELVFTVAPVAACVGAGSGNGLRGSYYDGTAFNSLMTSRTDTTINFDPADDLGNLYAGGGDTFSVRWQGQVEPRCSETYTFYTNSDDGVRLWVNGVQIISNWTDHGPTENSGTISLTAGQRYDIILEFYENTGGAVIQLSWSSPSTAKAIVPQSQLYSSAPPPTAPSGLTATAQCGGTDSQIRLSWTDNSNNEDGFRIYRGGIAIAIVGTNVTTYTDAGRTAGTGYSYIVKAYNAGGESGNSNTASAAALDCSVSYTLTVAKAGTGSGTVTSSPSGINFGADCCEPYNSGTIVTLTATAAAGSSFTSWAGCDSTSGNQCTLTINANRTVTATFGIPTCPASGNNVALSPSSIDVTQTSTASAPAGWSGGTFSSSNTGVATVSGSTLNSVHGGTSSITGSGWTASNGATGCSLTGATLTVRDFGIAPVGVTIAQGQSAIVTVNIASVQGGTMLVTVTPPAAASLPSGWSITPPTQTGAAGGSVSFTFSAAETAQTTVSNLRFTGAYNGHAHTGDDNFRVIVTSCIAAGSGNGLRGSYYDGTAFNTLMTSRTDTTVNFDPADDLGNLYAGGGDTFSIRWQGQVEPRCSETYTFYTNSDDGVRLWVNNQQVINNWTNHGPTEDSGTISLTSGEKYDITLEFYESGGGAVIQLFWSSLSTAKAIVPQSQLHSPPVAPTNLAASNATCGEIRLSWTDASTNETGFHVWRNVSPGGNPATIVYNSVTYYQIASPAANVTTYTDTNVTEGQAYSYLVTSYNNVGDSTVSSSNAVGPVVVVVCIANLSASSKILYRIDQGSGFVNYAGQTIRNGDILRFRIIIDNHLGTIPAYDLYVIDTLTSNLEYQAGSGRLDGNTLSERVEGNIITWNFPNPNLGDKQPNNTNWILELDAKINTSSTQTLDFVQNRAQFLYAQNNNGPQSLTYTVRTGLIPVRTGAARIPQIREIAP